MKTGPAIGDVIAGRYRVLGVAGQGATAVVFRAHDTRHGRDVAVKVLRDEMTRSLTADRFQREIGIVARLTHPNILPLHDSGEWNGQFYYVTPFIQGESLRHRLDRDGRLSPRDAVGIARGLAAALECAHQAGLVHRDIKPENVLLVGGQPLLADFGIARVLESGGRGRFTETGIALGTPQYMSPEQAVGDTVDARSDLYSLGCVLYEMLTGEVPFGGESIRAIVASRLTGDVPDVRESRGDVPPALARLVSALTARAPEARVPSATDLAARLGEVEAECIAAVPSRHWPLLARAAARARKHRGAVRVAAALLVVLAAAWAARDTALLARLVSHTPAVRTLAVLPLANLSGDVQQEYIADGLTDGLIADLSQIPGVKVISRTSVMRYKMVKKPLTEIARELKADALLEAAFTREGERVRITAALKRGSDEQSLWSASYDGRADGVLDLQRTVGLNVAREIGVRLAARPEAAARVVKPESQTAYLKGVYFAGQWRLAEAIGSLQRSVEIDPSNAAAYAALARAFYFRAFFGEVAPQEAFGQMRRAAEAALSVDPGLGEAHGLLALVNTHFDYDWAGAEGHFTEALALTPSNAQVHHDYAHFLLAMGRRAESIEQSRLAVELDPANPMLTSCLGWHSLFDQRFDESLAYAQEAQRLMPNYWALVVQGWAEAGNGHPAEAVESMRQAMALAPRLGFTRAALAHTLALNGETDEAHRILAQLLEEAARSYISAYDVTIVYAGLGDIDAALEWLARALVERSMFVVHLTWDARLTPLRADPRLNALIERLAIPPRPSGSALRVSA